MAGLYDGLPEPASASSSAPPPQKVAHVGARAARRAAGGRPLPGGRSPIFALDDVSLHLAFSFLPLPDVGRAVPSVCMLLRWLRDDWLTWRHFRLPLQQRDKICVAHLHTAQLRSMEELVHLSAAIKSAQVYGLRGVRGGARFSCVAAAHTTHTYCELPVPRVLWSLHGEGLTPWRGVCSCAVDARFALLPPWETPASQQLLPARVRLHLGISLWLPPEGVEMAHSFPGLYIKVALEDVDVFNNLALCYPDDPPCLSATCDVVIFRPSEAPDDDGRPTAAVLEEWGFRFCFGPAGHRHVGHGEMDGYDVEVCAAGRRKWRPPELCYTRAGERRQDPSFHVLLRGRRCDGLLE